MTTINGMQRSEHSEHKTLEDGGFTIMQLTGSLVTLGLCTSYRTFQA